MRQAESGNMPIQTTVRDDVRTVLGRTGTTIRQRARESLGEARNP
jgi:hypothetical protein